MIFNRKITLLGLDLLINKDQNLCKAEDFQLSQDYLDVLSRLHQNNYQLFLFSNQELINRGQYSLESFLSLIETINSYLMDKLNCSFTEVFYALADSPNKHWIKPGTGMLQQMQLDLILDSEFIDFKRSVVIADQLIDLQAAKKFGIENLIYYVNSASLDPQAKLLATQTLDNLNNLQLPD